MGLTVRSMPSSVPYDLLVNDEIRVTLRVAFPSMRRHRVSVAGKSYQYRYRTWHFNFHHHGRLDDRYTDFFACLAIDPRNPSREDTFIIPWEDVTGKTFSLHGGRRQYGGRYAPLRNCWRLIAQSARRGSPLKRVA